jgi:membrane-associated phospholipid phosphatase
MASLEVLALMVGLTLLWVFFKGKNRLLEATFLGLVVGGGAVLEQGLQRIFQHWGPVLGGLTTLFPGEKSVTVIAVYGFSAFLLVRHSNKTLIQSMAPLAVVIVSILTGLSQVMLKVQYPSDLLAGMVFGGVWLSLNILLLEVFRLLHKGNFKESQCFEPYDP